MTTMHGTVAVLGSWLVIPSAHSRRGWDPPSSLQCLGSIACPRLRPTAFMRCTPRTGPPSQGTMAMTEMTRRRPSRWQAKYALTIVYTSSSAEWNLKRPVHLVPTWLFSCMDELGQASYKQSRAPHYPVMSDVHRVVDISVPGQVPSVPELEVELSTSSLGCRLCFRPTDLSECRMRWRWRRFLVPSLATFAGGLALLALWENFSWLDRSGAEHEAVAVQAELKARLQRLEKSHQDEVADLRREISELRAAVASKPSLPRATDVDPPGQATLPASREALEANRAQTLEASSKVPAAQGLCNIFVMWNYPSGPPLFISKNLESWLHYSHGRCHFPWMINDTNIRAFIPDLPAEFERMPYDAAKSDIVRYALLYHHGGMYLDTDFLVAKDLAPILDRINDHDLISYTTSGQSCRRGSFSSNFLAGRKGSLLYKAVWEGQKHAMTSHCDDSLKANDKKVCCADDATRQCHIPWAGIGENIAHPVLKDLLSKGTALKIHCFEGDESFVPGNFQMIIEKTPSLQSAVQAFQRGGVKNPMDRIMYHLFASLGFAARYDGAALFDESTFVGALFRKSVGSFTEIPRDPLEDGPGAICASDGGICQCKGKVFFGRRFVNDQTEPKAELKDLVKRKHAVKDVDGEISCTVAVFGDPLFTVPKHCICQPGTSKASTAQGGDTLARSQTADTGASDHLKLQPRSVWGPARSKPPAKPDKEVATLTLPPEGSVGAVPRGRSQQGVLEKVLSSESALVNGWEDEIRMWCRALCEDWRFLTLTTILTFGALLGDDLRLLATGKEADNFFNVLIVVAFTVFTVEIIAASLGDRSYLFSFFFYLDMLATVTMLVDLTWFGNLLYCKDYSSFSGATAGSLEGAVATLADTRAARTVRILRLIRLGKLYKFYQRGMEIAKSTERLYAVPPGNPNEEMWDLTESGYHDNKEDSEMDGHAETRVGKKLSNMTSRRVIVLTLVMLFCSDFFNAESWGQEFKSSGAMGADLVYERFRAWCPTAIPGIPWCLQASPDETPVNPEEERSWYEQYLVNFVRSHLSGSFAWRLYWLGVKSEAMLAHNGSETTAAFLGSLGRLNQDRFLGTALPEDELWRWDEFSSWDPHGPIPEEVKKRLAAPWREQCLGFYGVPVSPESQTFTLSTACSVTDTLRCNEVHYKTPMAKTGEEGGNVDLLFAFDTRPVTQSAAGLNMLQTCFICLALAAGAISFARDAHALLLGPLERILVKLEAIRKNPLHAMKLGDIDFRMQELEEAEEANRQGCCRKKKETNDLETLETAILERTLIKLGGLLALGFGEAGAEIIVHNMQGGATAELNAMVPGQEVEAVFGFCSIRNFTDATDVLKEKVMVFVNQVSEIVHGICDTYHGSPNQNIGGNSFLVVWRLHGKDAEVRSKIADMAVMSFVCITIEVQKSNILAAYRSHPGLQQRFPDFRVSLGFGLHCGWAIEGAIGSEYKIDASYLSPNVNVASQLEAASTQLQLWILMSSFMVKLCSKELIEYLRMVDHVMLEGSKKCLRLFTLDLDHAKIHVKPRLRGRKKVYNRYKVRQMREAVKNELWTADFNLCETLANHSDFVVMREPYSKEFFERFAVGFRNYEAGEWLVARDLFLTCHYSEESCKNSDTQPRPRPQDGPVKALLGFMQKYDYEPPLDWQGYRHL
ncbi:hypothetical protein AK812_SmicGene26489 [Symbiodinium microadriaticum]|uniref:Guanylate cyclase domain-containing protein n=1 Tax=Symbiodinium microadriaticum TaxID=2951 RepID=A0A1Q9D9D6_SYMMI|nr:hypothetical protein AK812_SmicGene26489 [Symbiodinium microadriaticum]